MSNYTWRKIEIIRYRSDSLYIIYSRILDDKRLYTIYPADSRPCRTNTSGYYTIAGMLEDKFGRYNCQCCIERHVKL